MKRTKFRGNTPSSPLIRLIIIVMMTIIIIIIIRPQYTIIKSSTTNRYKVPSSIIFSRYLSY